MDKIPKIIIDTDAGVDDAIAIFMLLNAHKKKMVEIIAITTVNGNTSLENVNINVFRILECSKLTEIPVYSGASVGLVSKFNFHHKPYFGQDGFGDVIKENPKSISLLRDESASLALIRLVEANPGEVILVALGPLTNLAISINISAEWTGLLRDVFVMGGNIAGVGNHTMSAEFNFLCDAEAAKVTLDRIKIPIKLTPWETCVPPVIKITFEERVMLGSSNSDTAKLINLLEKDFTDSRFGCWLTCDQLSAAWALDDYTSLLKEKYPSEELVANTKSFFATVELSGNHARGLMIIDHYDKQKNKNNIICMNSVNKEKYMDYLKFAFQ